MPLPNEILEQLPEEYRENETLSRFNEVGDLAKSYVELRSLQGRSIKIPGEDAPEEDRKQFLEKLVNNAPELMYKPDLADTEQAEAFYRTFGRPEAPDKYSRPEDVKLNEDVEAELRKVFFDVGMTDAQFKKAMQAFSQQEQATLERRNEAIDEYTRELKGKWGVTFEDRVKAAEKINAEFYPGRDFGSISPKEIEALYKVHESLTGKGPQAATQGGQQSVGMTPGEAKEQAEEIMRKVHDPKSNLSHAEKLKLIEKRIKLLTEYAGYSDNMSDFRA
jgi:hypothetical protein